MSYQDREFFNKLVDIEIELNRIANILERFLPLLEKIGV